MKNQQRTPVSRFLILLCVLVGIALITTACYRAPAKTPPSVVGDDAVNVQGAEEDEDDAEVTDTTNDETQEPGETKQASRSESVVELIDVEEIEDEETPTSRLLRNNATELENKTSKDTLPFQPTFEPVERLPGVKGNTSSNLVNISKDFFDRIQTVTIVEGEPIKLKPIGKDPDDDPITYTFTKPFDQNGRWQTKLGDEGTYTIQITASDGELTITKPIKVKVLHRNRPPVIKAMEPLFVDEGKTLRIAPAVTDPEQDNLTVTYSGWMQRAVKEVGYVDAGQYQVTITAFDGQLNASISVPIIVNNVNRAPDFYVVVE